MRLPSILSLSILFVAACGGGEDSSAEPERVLSDRLLSAEREAVVSAPKLASGDFELSGALSALFARVAGGLDWAPKSERAELLLPLAEAALDAPLTAPGRARSLASQPEAVSEAIRAAAAQLGDGSDSRLVYRSEDYEDVKAAICDSYGCGEAEGELSADWQAALSPILRAALGVMEARAARSQALSRRSADWWTTRGAYGLILSAGARYDVALGEDRAYIGGDRSALYEAAAALAEAIEGARWPSEAAEYRLQTGAGWIIVGGTGDDRYEASLGATLLLVDMGGDDLYLAPVAANQSGDNAVSLLIDLGGNDRYTYPEAEAWKGGQLPADADGRADFSEQQQGVSASTAARQGAGRNGVALLYDLGEGSDRYEALRMSQGYAHQGVGVLFDEGGDDRYTGEAAVQGAGQFGIGLLIDRAGQDSYTAEHAAQGFGYVAGFGALFDRNGDDAYTCEPGVDGSARYRSAQHPEDGASSFCQGAGFGLRTDNGLAGGVGLLSDEAGDDSYAAGVFAQGSGYYNGLGVLVDTDGSDSYDAIHYAQGGAAHHAAGWLLDFGGDDTYGAAGWGKAYNLGAGWDRSVGVAYDGGGDDSYIVPPTSGGMGSAGGFGALLDASGSDDYQARYQSNLGFGSEVKGYVGVGLFLDGAGADTYLSTRADDSAWDGGETETGAGEDGNWEVFTNAGA